MVSRRQFIAGSVGVSSMALSGCLGRINREIRGDNTATITMSVENDTQTKEFVGLMVVESKNDVTPLKKEGIILNVGESVSKSYSIRFEPNSKTVFAYAGQPSVELEVFQEILIQDGGEYHYQFSIMNQAWSEVESN